MNEQEDKQVDVRKRWEVIEMDRKGWFTSGVVQYSLNKDRIFGDALSHQQDALLNTMATE